jgi:hypothetical protein
MAGPHRRFLSGSLFPIVTLFGVGAVLLVAPVASAKEKRSAAEAQESRGPTRAGDATGHYTILRGGKDTGCMLTLEPARAQLSPGCRDNGIVVFDPKGWSVAGGKLMLRARKGHTSRYEMAADGTWQKDVKEGGQPLSFRKIP